MFVRKELDFRGLRAVVAAAATGGISRASEDLHVSQPALSRIIRLTEEALGTGLFVRSATGVSLTPAGDFLIHRFRRSLNHLARAEQDLGRLSATGSAPPAPLHRLLTRRHLWALIETAECESVSFAARRLQISPSAVHRSLRECEGLAGTKLLERRRQRIVPTEAGDLLVRRGKLALAELRYALEELALHQGQTAGRVVIGCLPLARTMLVPRAITQLTAAHPGLRFSIVDGPYPALLHNLRCGDLDLIVGALRDPPPVEDVREEILFQDPLSILARSGHPLAGQDVVTVSELATWPWVVPRSDTPTRALFEALFQDADVPVPEDTVESSSLVAVRALLVESDRLTILSRHQVHYEEQLGILSVLPLQLDETERPIGVTTQTNTEPPPGVRAFLDELREICRELHAGSTNVPGLSGSAEFGADKT